MVATGIGAGLSAVMRPSTAGGPGIGSIIFSVVWAIIGWVIWSYVTHDDDGFPLLLQLGHYRDQLAREDGAWRFRVREITRDLGYSPLDPEASGRRAGTR